MNLLLNASNLRHGGGKTVAIQLINGIAALRPDDSFYIIVPNVEEFPVSGTLENVFVLPIPRSFHTSWAKKIRYNYSIFPAWCKQLKIDKVISLGNIAFPLKKIPQLVYFQLPQLVYPDSPAWKKMDIKTALVNRLMNVYITFNKRYASSYAVQTAVMKTRLAKHFNILEEKIYTLPNAAIATSHENGIPVKFPFQPLKLIFLSRYYAHKSFEILPAVAKLLNEQNLPVEITLTIDEKEGAGAKNILNALKPYKNVTNIGSIPMEKVSSILYLHHGILHPSLLESHSGAYAEAIAHQRLIFTSNYDFATNLLGNAAFYFDPLKAEDIVKCIQQALTNEALVKEKLSALDHIKQDSPNIEKVVHLFSEIIDTFA